MLREKFEKEVVILFTDICDYTRHTDLHGDLSGLALIQRHNQIVLPIIEKHKGIVIKTIGDAVMASFSSPLEAVKASVTVQKELKEYNRTVDESNRIHIRIGINIGQALVDQTDVHGDVVNVASRIQAQALPDQILISMSVYEKVRGIEDILCRSHGLVQVKGKAEPLELYRIIWGDEDVVVSAEPKVRTYQSPSVTRAGSVFRVIQLEVARQDSRLKISVNERIAGEESTIRNYEEIPVSMDWIRSRCQAMVETLNAVSRKGRFGREVLVKLRETGRIFYNELLTPAVKEKLKQTKAEYLSLNIDDQLIQVPWELLYDGREFLCQRFNMGRLVKTRQTVQGIKARVLARPLRMLIIADPKGDLKQAYGEGVQIQEHLANYGNFIAVTLRSEDITPLFLKEKMRYFDLVHFAGHTDYDRENPERGGWRLTRGALCAQDVLGMAGYSIMPTLIFSNSCQSGRTEEWVLKENFQDEIFGLAHAFLLSGVKHYVGTFWEILDEPSSRFAVEFYKYLLSGLTTGAAIRQARLSLIDTYGEETVAWASYLLYGDPTTNYLEQIKMDEAGEERNTSEIFIPEGMVRSAGTDQEGARPSALKKNRWLWAAAAGASLFFLILVLINHRAPEKPIPQNLVLPPEIILSQPTGESSDLQKTMHIIRLLSSYQDQLASRFRERGFFVRSKEQDTWTSIPLSISMILPDWERIDPDTLEVIRPHFERLFKRMVEAFTRTETMGLSILERERLSAVLQELQIGISDLSADSLKDAHRILSAQVILFPEPAFYQFDQELSSEISLRLVEARSSRILAAFSSAFSPQPEAIDSVASKLVTETMKTMQKLYPLQGLIVSIDNQQVEINLGSKVGLSPNQSFFVLGQEESSMGTIQIQSVYENRAMARILDQKEEFAAGDRVRAAPANQ